MVPLAPGVTLPPRNRVREALALLGIRRLLLGIHDPAFPGGETEDVGRGSPGSFAAAGLLELAAELGFDGLQLGPQGATSAANPSPYDGTLFSRDPLSLALGPLTTPEWGSLLRPETLEALAAGRPSGSLARADPEYTERAIGTAIAEVVTEFRRARETGENAFAVRLSRALGVYRAENAAWLESDGLYEVLRAEHGGGWREWRGAEADLDRRLFAPRPGEETAMALRRIELASRHAGALEAHAFVQLLLHEQHRIFQIRARRLGLSLFGDLQVGMSDRDAWAARAFLLEGWRLGAPPSRTNPEGQPWHYPVLDPRRYEEDDGEGGRRPGPAVRFLRTRIRKLLSEFDGVRIDHPHGLVCPWVYRAEGDPAVAVREGARLFESPDVEGLAPFAIARPGQLDRTVPRHADGWVRALDEAQVDRYAVLFDVVMAAARERGRGEHEIACEVLSTMPEPLRRVVERHGLGRFRVTQKADLDRPEDVYRPENARPEDWILLGNHDTRPILAVAEEWMARGAARRRAEALAARLVPADASGAREAFVRRAAGSARELAQASFADLFAGPARNVIVYFTDLFGEREPYNRPGTVSRENWSLRVPSDCRRAYAERRAEGRALDLPRALARALRARGDRFAGAHRDLLDDLERAPGGPLRGLADARAAEDG